MEPHGEVLNMNGQIETPAQQRILVRRMKAGKSWDQYRSDEPGAVETLYVRKTSLAKMGNPDSLLVTVEPYAGA